MIITIDKPPRGQGTQERTRIAARAITLTWAWGVTPSPGAATYVSTGEYPAVTPGAWVEIELFGRTFFGIVKGGPMIVGDTVVPTASGSDGHEIRLDFVDTRIFLGWDRVFGTFNNVESRLVGGVYRKRYWHVYPGDFDRWHKTFTERPLSAAQILDALFEADTIGSPWVRTYHNDQNADYNQVVDCSSGRALNDVIQEICDTQGLTVTISGGPYHMLFSRKGDGLLPEFPANSDQRRLELALSDAPTRVFVVGDRNLYLVLNVGMQPDWNRHWEQILSADLLAADLYHHETHTPTGSRYDSIPGDADHARGWQLAMARALEISVREYGKLRRARQPAVDFSDNRRYAGRSRMDMPAALYLRTILFRAFRPPTTIQVGGSEVPIGDLRLVSEQVAFVTHDPATGKMTASIQPPDNEIFAGGNGYAIARGYNIGSDIFGMIQPDRFNADDFVQSANVWQPLTYAIDESGDGSQFILMDEPMLNTSDLITVVDGWAVLKANPTFSIPEIRAALTFEGGRFIYRHGVGSRDDTLNAAGLRRELVIDGAAVAEVPYADGLTSIDKAIQLATTFLARPWLFRMGGFRIALEDGESAPLLLPSMSRITLEQSAQGNFATIELEADRPIRHYVPENILDRQVRMFSLLPGQQELRADAHAHKLLAAGLKMAPGLIQSAQAVLQGRIGDAMPTHAVTVKDGSGAFPVGTPLWRTPSVGSRPVMPAATTTDHRQFAGVVTRDGERADGVVRVQREGTVLARVKGPVAFGEPVSLSPGNDHLVKIEGDQPAIGSAQLDVVSNDTKLIQVKVGTGTGGVMTPVWA